MDYYVARWYDPMLGHFTQADTIIPEPGKSQSFDRYAYSNNNPLKYTDPSGHFIAIPILVALIGITGFAGGAAYYEYNVSGHSWWESKEYTTATIDAGMKGATIAYSATLVAIEAAAILPALAAQVGILVNNPSLFNWGIEQMGLGASEIGTGISSSSTSSDIFPETSKPHSQESNNSLTIDQDDAIKPGFFAGDSIQARGPDKIFTTSERQEIDRIGFDTGCHTCGSKVPGTTSGHFIPDHQPPSAININKAPQKLFPQCINCSRVQGGQVRNLLRKMDDIE